jgi:formylglycine-generating enzyme
MKKALWAVLACSILLALPAWGVCPPEDITGDCIVNLQDLAALSHAWLTGDGVPADMVLIPAGTFQMGNSTNAAEGNSDELPVHTVNLDSFAMCKYLITNEQYCAFLNSAYPSQLKMVDGIVYASGDTANSFPFCDTSSAPNVWPEGEFSQIAFSNNTFSVRIKGRSDMSKDPMIEVSWYGAVAYCNWRSQQEGKQKCYDLSTWACDFTKKGYRLATEAEWEYAARGGLSDKRFPWGDTITHSQANYYSSSLYSYDISPTRGLHPTWNDGILPYTSSAGSFPANGYGLYDMTGNVLEWCHDWYAFTYYRPPSPQHNPTGPVTGSHRVLRGGCSGYPAFFCRLACRLQDNSPADRLITSASGLSLAYNHLLGTIGGMGIRLNGTMDPYFPSSFSPVSPSPIILSSPSTANFLLASHALE